MAVRITLAVANIIVFLGGMFRLLPEDTQQVFYEVLIALLF